MRKIFQSGSKDSFRKDLSMPGLLREMRECFDRVPDLIVSRGILIGLNRCSLPKK